MCVFVLVLMRMCMSIILPMRLSMLMRLLVQLPVFGALRSKCPDNFCAGLIFGDPPQLRSTAPDKYRAGIARWFLFAFPQQNEGLEEQQRAFLFPGTPSSVKQMPE